MRRSTHALRDVVASLSLGRHVALSVWVGPGLSELILWRLAAGVSGRAGLSVFSPGLLYGQRFHCSHVAPAMPGAEALRRGLVAL